MRLNTRTWFKVLLLVTELQQARMLSLKVFLRWLSPWSPQALGLGAVFLQIWNHMDRVQSRLSCSSWYNTTSMLTEIPFPSWFSVFGCPAEEFSCPYFSPLDPPQPTEHDTKLCPLGSALFAGLSCSPPSPGAELKVQHTHLTDGRTKAVIFPQNRFEKQGRARI